MQLQVLLSKPNHPHTQRNPKHPAAIALHDTQVLLHALLLHAPTAAVAQYPQVKVNSSPIKGNTIHTWELVESGQWPLVGKGSGLERNSRPFHR
jgi:hypothetical protein